MNDADRARAQALLNLDFETIAEQVHEGRLYFDDDRLNELLFRMRARCAAADLERIPKRKSG